MEVGGINALLCHTHLKGDFFPKEMARFVVDHSIRIQGYEEVPRGYVFAIPDPEFFGVIPIESRQEPLLVSPAERYAFGVINSRSIVRVKL
jgi:hypothetical protein